MKTWCAYVIQSEPTGHLYAGVSTDPWARLARHNRGKGAKRTRAGRPWKVVWFQDMGSKGDALRLEARIKKMTRAKKLAFIGA